MKFLLLVVDVLTWMVNEGPQIVAVLSTIVQWLDRQSVTTSKNGGE